MNKYVSGQQFAIEIFMSPEMTNRNLSNKEYIIRIYQSILMRTPDAEGLDYWVNRLKSGTSRKDVIIEFTHSVEYQNMCKKIGIKNY